MRRSLRHIVIFQTTIVISVETFVIFQTTIVTPSEIAIKPQSLQGKSCQFHYKVVTIGTKRVLGATGDNRLVILTTLCSEQLYCTNPAAIWHVSFS